MVDTEELIRQLEEASVLVLSPNTPKPQREAAEKLFLDFRQYSGALSLCQAILGTTRTPYVQYETAQTIKLCVVREWAHLSTDDVCAMASHLLNYTLGRTDLLVYVRQEILHAVAMMVKLGWTSDERYRTFYYNNVNTLLGRSSTGEMTFDDNQIHARTVCGYFVRAVLGEISVGSRASEMGLTWDLHRRAKMAFEGDGLIMTFTLTLQLMHVYMQQAGSEVSNEVLALWLSVAESVLNWKFARLNEYDSIGYADKESSADQVLLRPGSKWTEIFANGGVLQMFIQMQSLCSLSKGPTLEVSRALRARLLRHTMQCLVQLGGLDGKVFPSVDAKLGYYRLFTELLVDWIEASGLHTGESNNVETDGPQMFAIAMTVSRLATCFFTFETIDIASKFGVYGFVPALEPLLPLMAQLSTACLHRAQTESFGENYNIEAFDLLLDAWVTLVSDQQFPTHSVFKWTNEIFRTFVAARVESEMKATLEDADEEYFEEENDVLNMDSQNLNMAALARLTPAESIELVSKEIQAKVVALRTTTEGLPILGALHQLILIAGYLIADPQDRGETPSIPEEICTMLTNTATPTQAQANNHAHHEPLMGLFQSIWLYLDFETEAIVKGYQHVISPLTAATLQWYLSRWSATYLLLSPDAYHTLPHHIRQSLGKDSELGKGRFNWIVEKIYLNLSRWYAEPDVTDATANLLLTLCKNTTQRQQMTHCAAFPQLLTLFNTGMPGQNNPNPNVAPPPQLPASVQRRIAQAVTMATAGNQDLFLSFMKDLLHPWINQTNTICTTSSGELLRLARAGDADAINVIITLLELLRGVIDGASSSTATVIYLNLQRLLDPINKLLRAYQHYPDVVACVLELYCSLVDRMINHLSEQHVGTLYTACVSLIKTYSAVFSGKYSGEAGVETAYDDLLLLLQLLTYLVQRDFVDYEPSDPSQSEVRVNGQAGTTNVCEVVLFGLGVVVPLMSKELLKYPALCSQYFKLLTFMSEIYPGQVLRVSAPFLSQIGQSFQMAILCDFGVPVARSGYEAISSLAVYVCEEQQKNNASPAQPEARPILVNLMRGILDTIMFRTFDSTLVSHAAEALLALIMAYQTEFMECAQEIIAGVADPQSSQRVAAAFHGLMNDNNLTMKVERANSVRFSKNLVAFLAVVRGLLVRK